MKVDGYRMRSSDACITMRYYLMSNPEKENDIYLVIHSIEKDLVCMRQAGSKDKLHTTSSFAVSYS